MLNVFIKKMTNFEISILTYVNFYNIYLANTILNNKFLFKKIIITIKFSIIIFLKKCVIKIFLIIICLIINVKIIIIFLIITLHFV